MSSHENVLAIKGSILRCLLECNDKLWDVVKDGRDCGFVKTSKVYSRKSGGVLDEVVPA